MNQIGVIYIKMVCVWHRLSQIKYTTTKNWHSFIVSIPLDTLSETLMLIVFFILSISTGLRTCINVAQEHLRSDALPDTTVIRQESNTGLSIERSMPYHCTTATPLNIQTLIHINKQLLSGCTHLFYGASSLCGNATALPHLWKFYNPKLDVLSRVILVLITIEYRY